MTTRDLVFFAASFMMLCSGAALLASRFASSSPALSSALETAKYLLPVGLLVLAAERLWITDLNGAAVLALCAIGIAVAQYSKGRGSRRRISSSGQK